MTKQIATQTTHTTVTASGPTQEQVNAAIKEFSISGSKKVAMVKVLLAFAAYNLSAASVVKILTAANKGITPDGAARATVARALAVAHAVINRPDINGEDGEVSPAKQRAVVEALWYVATKSAPAVPAALAAIDAGTLKPSSQASRKAWADAWRAENPTKRPGAIKPGGTPAKTKTEAPVQAPAKAPIQDTGVPATQPSSPAPAPAPGVRDVASMSTLALIGVLSQRVSHRGFTPDDAVTEAFNAMVQAFELASERVDA